MIGHKRKHRKALEHIARLEAENARLDEYIKSVDSTPFCATDSDPVPPVYASGGTIGVMFDLDTPKPKRKPLPSPPVVLDEAYFEKKREESRYHYPVFVSASSFPFSPSQGAYYASHMHSPYQ